MRPLVGFQVIDSAHTGHQKYVAQLSIPAPTQFSVGTVLSIYRNVNNFERASERATKIAKMFLALAEEAKRAEGGL